MLSISIQKQVFIFYYLENLEMPLRQIRKHRNSKSKSKSNSRSRKTKRNIQRGGNSGGRVALPMAYFSKSGAPGYYADGSDALRSCPRQHAVSQGVISPDGNWAGPNLYPQLGGNVSKPSQKGGSCGCRRRTKRKTQIRKH